MSPREARDKFKCYESTDGYDITTIGNKVLQDLINNNPYEFRKFFNDHIPDLASSCELFAYKTLYQDLRTFRNQHPDARALQFTMQPFSDKFQARLDDDHTYTFMGTPEGSFTAEDRRQYQEILASCNAKDLFSDSALVFTDAKYNNKYWQDSLDGYNAAKYTYTNFLKCAISDASNDAPDKCVSNDDDLRNDCCEGYLQADQRHEHSLTNFQKRNNCPMIPDFKEYSNNNGRTPEVITDIAKAFVRTVDNFITKSVTPFTTNTWENKA